MACHPHVLFACPTVCRRFAYLSQPLLRDSAHSIIKRWQQQAGAQQHQQQPQGRRLAWDAPASQEGSSSSGGNDGVQQETTSMLSGLLTRMQRAYARSYGTRRSWAADGAVDSHHTFKLSDEDIEDDAFGTMMQVGLCLAPTADSCQLL
jgi:hypothetical protein